MTLATSEEVWYLFWGYCEYDDALYDLSRWCNNMDCSTSYIGQSYMKKVFQVTTVTNEIVQLFTGESPLYTDTDAVFQYYETLGTDIGKLLRYAIDFDPVLIKTLQ